MPTINQLIKHGREKLTYKSKSPIMEQCPLRTGRKVYFSISAPLCQTFETKISDFGGFYAKKRRSFAFLRTAPAILSYDFNCMLDNPKDRKALKRKLRRSPVRTRL